MEEHYDPAAVEKAAQAYWEEHGTFEVKEDKGREKYYCLSMLPYPSGRLHMGHVRNYTIGDVLAASCACRARTCCSRWAGTRSACRRRTRRCSNGVPPAKWTRDNIAYMKRSCKSLGFAHRLGARARHLRPELLPLEPVAVPADAARRASPTARPASSTGIRSTRPCSPTSR